MLLEKTLESPLDCKEIQPVHLKWNLSWIFTGRTDAEAEAPLFWPPDGKVKKKRPWCWERLKAVGEGDNRGWEGWMASPTWWIWVWASSRSWWWTGQSGMLQSMGLQSWIQLSNWAELFEMKDYIYFILVEFLWHCQWSISVCWNESMYLRSNCWLDLLIQSKI